MFDGKDDHGVEVAVPHIIDLQGQEVEAGTEMKNETVILFVIKAVAPKVMTVKISQV